MLDMLDKICNIVGNFISDNGELILNIVLIIGSIILCFLSLWAFLWFIFKILNSLLNLIFDWNLDEDFGGKIGHFLFGIPHIVFVFPLMLCFMFLRFKLQKRDYMIFNHWKFYYFEEKIINLLGYTFEIVGEDYEVTQYPFGILNGGFLFMNPGGTYIETRYKTIVYNK